MQNQDLSNFCNPDFDIGQWQISKAWNHEGKNVKASFANKHIIFYVS